MGTNKFRVIPENHLSTVGYDAKSTCLRGKFSLGVLGAGASVLRKLFPDRDKKDGSRVSGVEGDAITLGDDDYEIRDVD